MAPPIDADPDVEKTGEPDAPAEKKNGAYPAAVVYIGDYDAVDVIRPDGSRERVATNGTFRTTQAHADALLKQSGNWSKPKKEKGA